MSWKGGYFVYFEWNSIRLPIRAFTILATSTHHWNVSRLAKAFFNCRRGIFDFFAKTLTPPWFSTLFPTASWNISALPEFKPRVMCWASSFLHPLFFIPWPSLWGFNFIWILMICRRIWQVLRNEIQMTQSRRVFVSYTCLSMPLKSTFYHFLPSESITNKKAPALQKSEDGGLLLRWKQLFFCYLWLFFVGSPTFS